MDEYNSACTEASSTCGVRLAERDGNQGQEGFAVEIGQCVSRQNEA